MKVSDIHLAFDELSARRMENWDADDSMPDEHVKASPLGRFIIIVDAFDSQILEWLTFFAARQALPCWEQIIRDQRPRKVLANIEKLINGGVLPDWTAITSTIDSPFNDCLYSATQSAADAVVYCAKYIQTKNSVYAIYCLSSADVAFDHVTGHTEFRDWLLTTAIPASFKKREFDSVSDRT